MRLALICFLTLFLTACGQSGRDSYVGYVDADFMRPAPVAAGRLTSLAVKRGDTVKAGDVLFTLDNVREQAARDEAAAALAQAQSVLANLKIGKRPQEVDLIRAQLKQAEAKRDLARLTYNRQKELLAQKVVSVERRDTTEAEFRAAEAQVAELHAALSVAALPARSDEIKAAEAAVAAADAKLREAEWQLGERQIITPTAARVEDTYFEPGDFVAAAAPVMSLLPFDTLHVKFYVPQAALPNLKIGGKVSIACDGCAAPVKGEIRFIASEAEFTPPVIYSENTRTKLMFRVEAAPDTATSLHPGLPVTVTAD